MDSKSVADQCYQLTSVPQGLSPSPLSCDGEAKYLCLPVWPAIIQLFLQED